MNTLFGFLNYYSKKKKPDEHFLMKRQKQSKGLKTNHERSSLFS